MQTEAVAGQQWRLQSGCACASGPIGSTGPREQSCSQHHRHHHRSLNLDNPPGAWRTACRSGGEGSSQLSSPVDKTKRRPPHFQPSASASDVWLLLGRPLHHRHEQAEPLQGSRRRGRAATTSDASCRLRCLPSHAFIMAGSPLVTCSFFPHKHLTLCLTDFDWHL